MPTELLPPGIHHEVSREQYEADPGIRQSHIKKFIQAKTPAHFRYAMDHAEEDKDYLRMGSALDCLIDNPSMFQDRFAVAPTMYPCEPTKKDPRTVKPWTMAADWCKEWKADRERAGQTFLTIPEYERVVGMFSGLEQNSDIRKVLRNCERQVCIIAIHPAFGCRMKCLIDLWPLVDSPAHGEWAFDLKSTGMGADDHSFHKQCWQVQYNLQAYWYMFCAQLAGFDDLKSFGLIAAESDAPYGTKVHYFEWDDKEIELARRKVDDHLPRYMECLENNLWPGYSEAWAKVRSRSWMLAEEREPEVLV